MAAIAEGINSAPAPFRPLENQIQEFRNIVLRQLGSFRAIALRYLRNHADAEDAVQDALLSAYAHLDQFKGKAQMSTWLTTIVINAARMKLRQRSRNVHISLDEPAPETHSPLWEMLPHAGPNPEELCRRSEFVERLTHLSNRLSPCLLRTIQLRAGDGLSTRETARLLRVPSGTVKARVARARRKLKHLVDKT
jgi:RNA polymerase sigma-70 factor (ECF subfamily)